MEPSMATFMGRLTAPSKRTRIIAKFRTASVGTGTSSTRLDGVQILVECFTQPALGQSFNGRRRRRESDRLCSNRTLSEYKFSAQRMNHWRSQNMLGQRFQ